jgi:hypothetical protein
MQHKLSLSLRGGLLEWIVPGALTGMSYARSVDRVSEDLLDGLHGRPKLHLNLYSLGRKYANVGVCAVSDICCVCSTYR